MKVLLQTEGLGIAFDLADSRCHCQTKPRYAMLCHASAFHIYLVTFLSLRLIRILHFAQSSIITLRNSIVLQLPHPYLVCIIFLIQL